MKRVSVIAIFFGLFILFSNLPTLLAQTSNEQAIISSNHTGYLDSTTIPITYHVVGEIGNIGTISLSSLKVNATFYDQNNIRVGSESSTALLDVLLRGRVTPFEVIWVGNSASQISNCALSLQSSEYIGEKPSALQVSKDTAYIDEAGFQKINGTVRNLATSNATNVKVVATFYDAQGKVVAVTSDYTLPSTIMPESTEPFELELSRKGVDFSGYALTAESTEYAALLPEPSTLTILLALNSTVVNSGANVQVQVHVTNATLPVKDAAAQLISDKGGVFTPQSGYTNSEGIFETTFTSPTVTTQTLITIRANATKTGYIMGEDRTTITVKANSHSSTDQNQSNPPLWIYSAAILLVVTAAAIVVSVSRRKKNRQKTRTRARVFVLAKVSLVEAASELRGFCLKIANTVTYRAHVPQASYLELA